MSWLLDLAAAVSLRRCPSTGSSSTITHIQYLVQVPTTSCTVCRKGLVLEYARKGLMEAIGTIYRSRLSTHNHKYPIVPSTALAHPLDLLRPPAPSCDTHFPPLLHVVALLAVCTTSMLFLILMFSYLQLIISSFLRGLSGACETTWRCISDWNMLLFIFIPPPITAFMRWFNGSVWPQ